MKLLRPLLLVVLVTSACLDTVGDELRLPALPLPSAFVGAPYAVSLGAAGGTPPFRYGIEGLPPGFSFFPGTGRLEGPATETGTFSLRVSVEDGARRRAERTYTLEVLAAQVPADAGTDAGTDAGSDAGSDAGEPDAGSDAGTDAGSDGGATVLGVANWNVEWFGDVREGPSNDALQVSQVAKVIARGGAEVWALLEVVETTRFAELLQSLPDHEGLVANELRVAGGGFSYRADEQKPAFVWRRGALEDVSASLILAEYDYAFAGRPPLVIEATVQLQGVRVPVTFVVVHFKAQLGDPQDWVRRRDAALHLKAWLDALPAEREVLVLGDWNDDLDHSIAYDLDGGVLDTPFRALVEDADYTFLTAPLTSGNLSTTVRYDTPIDHQLATAALASRYVQGSLEVLRPEAWSPPVSAFASTTSDHYPVRTRFALQGTAEEQPPDAGSCAPPVVIINELLPQPGPVGAPQFDRQFVELYNPGPGSIELSGWRLDDDKSYLGVDPTRHVFAPGTRLEAGAAVVVYSGASALPAGVPWAIVASGGDGLRLNRGVNDGSSGDSVYLSDASGELVDHVRYRDTWFDVALNRAPDLAGCAPLDRHDTVAPGRLESPGTRANGTSF